MTALTIIGGYLLAILFLMLVVWLVLTWLRATGRAR